MALDRHCADCGMLCDDAGEFHPYMFCVLKKARRDPWVDFCNAFTALTGRELPRRPPAVRDLPINVTALPTVGELDAASAVASEPEGGHRFLASGALDPDHPDNAGVLANSMPDFKAAAPDASEAVKALGAVLDGLSANLTDYEVRRAQGAYVNGYQPEPGEQWPDDPVKDAALRERIWRAEITAAVEAILNDRYEALWQALPTSVYEAIQALADDPKEANHG